jgi:fibronectin-binding autotransporter adhesin
MMSIQKLVRLVRRALFMASSAAGLLLSCAPWARGAAYVPLSGANSWNVATNWNPAVVPTGLTESAVFDSPTANRTITLDAAIIMGTITFDNNSTFSNALSDGTGGSLTLGTSGSGATIVSSGIGAGLTTISATMAVDGLLTVNITNTTGLSSAAGSSLSLTGAMNGAGGLTKTGDGVLTIAAIPGTTNATKNYSGPTIVNAGRLRFSPIGAPMMSSSVTVASGGQLFLIPSSASNDFVFGARTLMLNGLGLPIAGPYSATSQGALRFDPSSTSSTAQISWTSNNPIVLATTSGIWIGQNSTDLASFTALNTVSGAGGLVKTGPGTLFLNANDTYSGGTTVSEGSVVAGAVNGSLGTGNVSVEAAAVKLTIQTGVVSAIADTAALTLAGAGAAGTADNGFAELQTGVNEIVAGLVLGTVAQPLGTYGSTASNATFKNDEYFSGTGIVTVIPEPGATATLLTALAAFLGLSRSRAS